VTIDAQGPQITITGPSGRTGRTGTLTFTYDSSVDNTGTFTCTVTDPQGATIASGTCSPANGLAWTASFGGTYTGRVNGTDGLGNTTFKTQTWTVDANGPTIQAGQCTQPGLDESTTNCQIAVTDNDIVAVQCRIVGVTAFGTCPTDASFKNVTVEDLAAGANTIEVRAVDDLGNIGNTAGFAPVFASYRTGHVVLEGHDYLNVNADTARILSNAVRLSYVFTRDLGRPPQVLIWCATSTCDSSEERNVKDILATVGVGGGEITEFFDPADLVGKGLVPRHDVFIVHDQNGRHGGNLAAIGRSWTTPMLESFVGLGGTVIVLDGMDASGGQPSSTFQLLIGSGALTNIQFLRNATDDRVNYGVSDAALQVGVTDGYIGPKYTIAYLVFDDRWRKSFFINTDQTMVLHRLF
jgi:hypothetical protein